MPDLAKTLISFMDGGEHVRSCTESQVNDNIDAVVARIQKEDADVVFYRRSIVIPRDLTALMN